MEIKKVGDEAGKVADGQIIKNFSTKGLSLDW